MGTRSVCETAVSTPRPPLLLEALTYLHERIYSFRQGLVMG